MARAKKDGIYVNAQIESAVYKKLEKYCAETGCTKTAVIERALTMFIEDYERKQEILKTTSS